jgi:hypothetical protein
MIPLATILASLYSQVATATAGAAARARLTGGVYPADQVLPPVGSAVQLPPFPFALWRAGPVNGATGDVRSVVGTWWVYTLPGQARQAALCIEALSAAYPRDAVGFGVTTAGPIGQEFYDAALGANGRALTITYRRRD